MAVDFHKLFHDCRLTPSEPEHLSYIKGELAALRFEDPSSYERFSKHYGVTVDVEAKVVPVKVKMGVVQVQEEKPKDKEEVKEEVKEEKVKEPKKPKRGRPKKKKA